MNEISNSDQQCQREPDGCFEEKHGNTLFKVKVFFDHDGNLTAEDRLKRVIMAEASKKAG